MVCSAATRLHGCASTRVGLVGTGARAGRHRGWPVGRCWWLPLRRMQWSRGMRRDGAPGSQRASCPWVLGKQCWGRRWRGWCAGISIQSVCEQPMKQDGELLWSSDVTVSWACICACLIYLDISVMMCPSCYLCARRWDCFRFAANRKQLAQRLSWLPAAGYLACHWGDCLGLVHHRDVCATMW